MDQIVQKLRTEPMFYYGQKLYVIEPHGRGEDFTSTCPICDGTKKIEYRGHEFNCPLCQSGGYRSPNYLYLRGYQIIEYIVNKITIRGPEVKKAYGNNVAFFDLPTAGFEAFAREGNGYDGIHTKSLIENEHYVDPGVDTILNASSPSDYVFTTTAPAKTAMKALIDRDKEKLEKFNKMHGTNYEYPFD